MERSRIQWVDNMKFVCILFVMLSHLECSQSIPDEWYAPFFLNGFLFAAGWVYRQEPSFLVFSQKKVRGLFVPWLVFSVGNILLSQVFSFHDHGNLWEELKRNFLQIRGQGDGVWFVAALFLAFLPFYFLIRGYERSGVRGKSLQLCLITFLLSLGSILYTKFMVPAALPWHLEYVFQAVFFLTLGYLCRTHGMEFSPWWAAVYAALVFLGMAKPEMSLAEELIYTYAAQISGVFALAALSRRMPQTRFGACIGANTLICFALHGKVMSFLQWALGRLEIYGAILENTLLSLLLAIGMTFIMAVILLIPIWVLNRWFPFLLGRKGRKR